MLTQANYENGIRILNPDREVACLNASTVDRDSKESRPHSISAGAKALCQKIESLKKEGGCMSDIHTRHTLAAACGITPRQLDRHIQLGTLRIDRAKEKTPGIGTTFSGAQVNKFIQAMQGKARYRRATRNSPALPSGQAITQ